MICPGWSTDATPAEEIHISAGVARVYESTVKHAKSTLLDHGTLKVWHRMLFEKIVPVPYYAGNFRGVDLRRPCLNGNVEIGGHLGAPPHHVDDAMYRFASELRVQALQLDHHLRGESRPHYQTLAKIALVAWAMATFIRIHPFGNGNGRIGRLMVNYLCHRYELPMPFRKPSRRPLEAGYGDAGKAAMLGNMGPTFQYILDLVLAQKP